MREWRSECPTVEAYTSGSTGEPKRILLLKSDMRISAENTIRHFGLDGDSVLALPLSVSYIAGKMMAVRAEVCGGRLIELPVSNHFELAEPVDLLAVVPSQIPSVLEQPEGFVKNLLVGGAPMTAGQEEQLAASGINAWVGYGMTETCSHVALRRVGAPADYRAVGDVRFSITDEGCLVINSEAYSWHRLVTRDVVELTSPRSFRWIGRADNVINSGGIKIHPEKLENEIRTILPALPDFFITSEAHPQWGSVPVMVMEEGAETEDIGSVLRTSLADSRHTPHKIYVTHKLPRTTNNKLLRKIPENSHEI